jgi:hypothetical protein
MPLERKYWLDRSENVTRLYRAVWGVGIALLVAELFFDRHEEFEFAVWFGFFALFGFVACVGLVLAAKALRRILMRPENYYDR